MKASSFVTALADQCGIDYYVGVPDSYLRAFCDYVTDAYGVGNEHIIAENEGGAVGLAAGHFLASGKPALVYMQNSGIGNIVNPVCSLLWPYQIPALLLVGWRGEPGVHDEPQHIFQGQITNDLLECMGIEYSILSPDVAVEQFVEEIVPRIQAAFSAGKQFALVCRKGTFQADSKRVYANDFTVTREHAVEIVTRNQPEDCAIVSTTGKLSRELFETREKHGEPHDSDFLIVGSMGHTSMIGAGVAQAAGAKKIAILDGDGSCLMHMGALPVLASMGLRNVVHFVFNNGAHETVGGMPTVSPTIDYGKLAEASGYALHLCAQTEEEIEAVVQEAFCATGPVFVELRVQLGSRKDLGRPTQTPIECRDNFMAYVQR